MKKKTPLDKTQLPEPIYDANPDYIELYWKAWEYAWDHVYERKDAPAPKYMDEALNPNVIWIWDSCFMVLYCRYAPEYFPGIQTLNNFYLPLHGNLESPLRIQHIDNPPLFAWVEYEYFKYTGDINRIKWVLIENQFLQKHYDFIKEMKRLRRVKIGIIPTAAKWTNFGFQWSGTRSGMDNTPRGRGKYRQILWIDLLAQQGLAAENIMKMANYLQNGKIFNKFEIEYDKIRELLNKYYWNEEDGIYYDIEKRNPFEQVKVKSPAAYWPMLAGLCNKNQAEKLAEHADNLNSFGGEYPWPSVAREDPDFSPRGTYWRGGIWLPMAYLGTKALDRYGFYEISDKNAEKLLNLMVKTFKEYEPPTIWEVYSPSEPKPATYKHDKEIYRPNFCGWSALGPISMLIENILGFHEINALENKIEWRLYRKNRHGIKRLKFGKIITDIIYENGEIKTNSNFPYILSINDKEFKINSGSQKFDGTF